MSWRDQQQRIREWEEEYGADHKRLTEALGGIDAIENRFDSVGREGLPEAYLLGFSTKGDGRAIIANGNPDEADHTSVYVPGTGASLPSVGGDITRMNSLWRTADAMTEGENVSTILWVGYDAPDDPKLNSPFPHYAHDGAAAFSNFTEGIKEANTAESGGHHTAIGHSYGTTVIGATARMHVLYVDDVIFAGSPGVEVSHATEMDVPIGHVWNQEAEGDWVPEIGRFSHGGGFVVPSDVFFGAKQMTTDTQGHSNYWQYESESLRNQAAVVTGNYGEVSLEE